MTEVIDLEIFGKFPLFFDEDDEDMSTSSGTLLDFQNIKHEEEPTN